MHDRISMDTVLWLIREMFYMEATQVKIQTSDLEITVCRSANKPLIPNRSWHHLATPPWNGVPSKQEGDPHDRSNDPIGEP